MGKCKKERKNCSRNPISPSFFTLPHCKKKVIGEPFIAFFHHCISLSAPLKLFYETSEEKLPISQTNKDLKPFSSLRICEFPTDFVFLRDWCKMSSGETHKRRERERDATVERADSVIWGDVDARCDFPHHMGKKIPKNKKDGQEVC